MDNENRTRKNLNNLSMQQIIEASLELSKGIDPRIDLNVCSYDIKDSSDAQNEYLLYIIESMNEIINESAVISEIIITNPRGTVLFTRNGSDKNSPGFIVKGANLSIDHIGCNALGLALKHCLPMKVTGEKHYPLVLKDYVSVGIPIMEGDVLLGCAGFISSIHKSSVHLGAMENVIATAVSAALKMLEARRHLDGLCLLKEFVNNSDKKKPMMMVDLNLNVVQINREAEVFLGKDKGQIVGHLFTELMAEEFNPDRKKPSQQYELSFKSSYGSIKVLADIVPCLTEMRRVIGWSIFFLAAAPKRHSGDCRKPSVYEFKDIIGKNPDFMRVLQLARAVAHSPSSILITGESGTGKELVAQAIHNAGHDNDTKGPFVAINCAAIPAELLETELFGYVYGAFTGARKGGMKGKFQLANDGTLFLDEIGDMPLELQAKLLRAIQERAITPVGGSQAIPVNIRIISATNQDLDQLVEEKRFRKDLYYRLNVINLQLPSLCKRKDDISVLVDHFIREYNQKLNKNILSISPEALHILEEYNWPGNVRELENIIERAVNLAVDVIYPENLNPDLLVNLSFAKQKSAEAGDDEIISLEEMEKRQIIKTIKAFGGNISYTANALNIGRTTLYRKIKKYGLLPYVKENDV